MKIALIVTIALFFVGCEKYIVQPRVNDYGDTIFVVRQFEFPRYRDKVGYYGNIGYVYKTKAGADSCIAKLKSQDKHDKMSEYEDI